MRGRTSGVWVAMAIVAGMLAGCRGTPKVRVWRLELVSNPSAPVAGASTLFRALLTDAKGVPIDGGQAALVLEPAGGAGVRVVLEPRGNGIYAARATVPAMGAWTATVTLTRQGRTEIRRWRIEVKPKA